MSVYHRAPVTAFLSADPAAILGTLASANAFPLDQQQRDAWEEQIGILKTALDGVAGTIFLEFEVPRLGSRIDAVVVSGPASFRSSSSAAKNIRSRGLKPGLGLFAQSEELPRGQSSRAVFPYPGRHSCASNPLGLAAGPRGRGAPAVPVPCQRFLRRGIRRGFAGFGGSHRRGSMGPAPTGQRRPSLKRPALYARHSVDAISRSDAGARNLRITSSEWRRSSSGPGRRREKAIVFVTGVPGAGKTLVGLNVATTRRDESQAPMPSSCRATARSWRCCERP